MSMLLMVAAMRTKVGNPLRKLVLIKLADNANDHGECWPSYQYIADQCEISKRSVMNHIASLSSSGLLRKEFRPGPKGNSSNLYIITLGGAGDSLGVVQELRQGSAGDSLGGSAGAAPRTSHSFEPVNESLDLGACAAGADECPAVKLNYSMIQQAYNEICPPTFPACCVMNEERKKQIRAMGKIVFMDTTPFTQGIDVWRQYFTDCLANPYWCGVNDIGWRATFDFVTNPKNAIKVMESMN